jgi:GntR family transcriptional regulator/MocR family aminotransferase
MKSSSGSRAIAGVLLTLLEKNGDARMALSTRVYRAIRSGILDGSLRPGDRLPSTRVLAADLAVSRSTAESAYAQLEEEGYLVRQTGSGSFVGTGIAQDVRARPGKPIRGSYAGTSIPDLSVRGQQIAVMGSCTDASQLRAFSLACRRSTAFPSPYGSACYHVMHVTDRTRG